MLDPISSKNKTRAVNGYYELKVDENYSWLKEVDKFSLANAIYNLDSSCQTFFKGVKKGKKEQGHALRKAINYFILEK